MRAANRACARPHNPLAWKTAYALASACVRHSALPSRPWQKSLRCHLPIDSLLGDVFQFELQSSKGALGFWLPTATLCEVAVAYATRKAVVSQWELATFAMGMRKMRFTFTPPPSWLTPTSSVPSRATQFSSGSRMLLSFEGFAIEISAKPAVATLGIARGYESGLLFWAVLALV